MLMITLKSKMLRGIALACLAGVILAAPARADGDYKFVDEAGDEIILPQDIPVYTRRQPGPWEKIPGLHDPVIKTRMRMTGLEAVRVVDISIRHPMEAEGEDGRIEKIYVTDKDGLMVGYYKFSEADPAASGRMLINGSINYFEIYVQCSRHGMWRTNYRIE